MAICNICDQEMTANLSCENVPYTFQENETTMKVFAPIKHGDDGWGKDGQPCHDCGAPVGAFHHTGCDAERCPRCFGQAISCECIDLNIYADHEALPDGVTVITYVTQDGVTTRVD